MDKLIIKYPALVMPKLAVATLKRIKEVGGMSQEELYTYYRYFKANVSCLKMKNIEYAECIKWFRDTMEYKI